MKIFLFLLFTLSLYAQDYPIFKDVQVYKGSYSVIKFYHKADKSADSVSFNLRANRDDTTYTLRKYNSGATGGDSTQIDIDGKLIKVTLTATNTAALTPGFYYYYISDDSTTIYAGYLKVLSIGY